MKNSLFLVLLFLSVSIFSQSPWTKKKSESSLQLSFTTISYDKVFGSPDYNTERKINDNTLQLYGEFGLSDKTTFFANVPLKLMNAGNIGKSVTLIDTPATQKGSQTSIGNIQLGIKHNFSNKGWILSGQLGIEANTGSFDQPSGLRTGYDAWTFTPLFLAGKSFGNNYFQAFTGVDIRTNDYSSNFKIGGEYGGKIFKDFWLIGFLDIVTSFKNGERIEPASNSLTAAYVNNQEYGAFGAKLIYEFTNKFGVNAGFGGAFFGNNVAKAPALSFGLYHKF